MKNIIFLDCEFNDLLFPELLSVGLVAANGGEHYVELDPNDASADAPMSSASSFVQDHVLSQWGRVPGASCSHQEMRERTAAWLLAVSQRSGEPIKVAFDHPNDYRLLVELLSESVQWEVVRNFIIPYNVTDDTARFDASIGAGLMLGQVEKQRGIGRHHALADAHALRAAFVAAMTGKRVKL